MTSHMIEAGILQRNVITHRKFFDIQYEWTYDEVLNRCFDGAYSLPELGENVFVGTIETGFDFGKMTAVHKDAIVGKIHSFNSAYKLILFKVSSFSETMIHPKNSCYLLMRAAKMYDQLPSRKGGSTGPLKLHNWIIENYLMRIPSARFLKVKKQTVIGL